MSDVTVLDGLTFLPPEGDTVRRRSAWAGLIGLDCRSEHPEKYTQTGVIVHGSTSLSVVADAYDKEFATVLRAQQKIGLDVEATELYYHTIHETGQ